MSPLPLTLPPAVRAGLVVVLFLASSAMIHFAVTRPGPRLEWLALTLLVCVPFCVALVELRWRAWLAFVALACALHWLVQVGGGRPILYLPSILIPGALAWFFGRTLAAGRQPLVASVALAARPQTPDYLLAYSRRLTQMWTGVFIALCASALLLAVFAPHGWWSFMANCGNYLLIGLTVVLEYVYRRLRFRAYAHPGFFEYLTIVMRADPRRMRGG